MNKFYAKIIFYLIEGVRGEKVHAYLKELEKNQSLPRSDIESLQRNKLNTLLKYVIEKNDYYKNKFNGFDVANSFESLPILLKDELRDNYKSILTGGSNRLDLVETSGSTGVPLQFYRDRVVFGYTLASLYRAHKWWGIDVGCKEAMLWGVPVSFKGKLKIKAKDFLLNRFREVEYNINPTTLHKFYTDVVKKKPDYIFGYSSMVYEFAMYLKENSINLKSANLLAAICTAEKIYDFQRNLIEEVFGCKVVSEYGATETGIISYECQYGSNHISDDCVYVEIVDEKNRTLPRGETGRVLVTVLNNFSSPIIRYDIGDIASRSNKTCDCGVNLSILEKIDGRTSDVVIGPNGEIYHSIIFYYIIKELTQRMGGIKQFKVLQKKINLLEFHIVKGSDFIGDAEAFIRAEIKKKFGASMNLVIYYQEYIKRNQSGKLRDFETELDTLSLLPKFYANSVQDLDT